jgi:hypothetical protein
MAKKKAKQPSEVYQLKVTLKGIRPPIWRRVQVGDCTLGVLHQVIQAALGWTDSHLHSFEVGGEQYGEPDPESGVTSERRLELSAIASAGVKKFTYTYDFGDNWEHTIEIEKTLPAEAGVRYPRCLTGKRACPPEDCGGPWGYADFLAAIQDPAHEGHEEMLEWAGGEFDPEEFDLDAVNAALAGG